MLTSGTFQHPLLRGEIALPASMLEKYQPKRHGLWMDRRETLMGVLSARPTTCQEHQTSAKFIHLSVSSEKHMLPLTVLLISASHAI